MLTMPQPPQIHLPRSWQGCVKSVVLYAIALAHYSIVYARAWAADSINARVRLSVENDRLREECALLREELRLKDIQLSYGRVESELYRLSGLADSLMKRSYTPSNSRL